MTPGYFRDSQVAFVGTPQIYGNLDESWIVQGTAEQAYGFYGTTQKGFFGKDMQLFIGANHVVRVAREQIAGFPARRSLLSRTYDRCYLYKPQHPQLARLQACFFGVELESLTISSAKVLMRP